MILKCKKNKGSSLIIVLLMIIIMSLLGITIVTVTISGMDMSIFYSDINKAYFTAEAAVEQVANVLDSKVAIAQEIAREEASDHIQTLLQNNPNSYRKSNGEILQDAVDTEFKSKYMQSFNQSVQNEFSNINAEYLKVLLETSTMNEFGMAYKDLSGSERMTLESAVYEFDNVNETHKIVINTQGIYNEYKKKLSVTFNLLPDPSKIPYQGIQKVSLNKSKPRPEIFKKALLSEKNIISAGGDVTINGNVLCFGSVPSVNGEEDQSAEWKRYGGIVAGMCEDMTAFSSELGFDPAKTGAATRGSLTINGDAATMAYIHSVFGTDVNPSNIVINGNTYARSIRLEEKSNYSTLDLKGDVYVSDNLQVDSHESIVNVDGKYFGFVDAGYMIDGSGSDSESNQLKDSTQYKRTSSISINGDSVLNLKNEIYIGGSTFFKKVLDVNGFPYMTGISVLKSGKRIGNAFMSIEESNPDGKLYWYENGSYTNPTPYVKNYTISGTTVGLFSGRQSDGPNYSFPIAKRGMHFKGIWENLWKDDEVYSSYIDSQNINITGSGISGNLLNGYSSGAIVANGKVYGGFDFSGGSDPTLFHTVQNLAISEYHTAIQDLLTESFSEDAPKLNYTIPTKSLDYYIGDLSRYTGADKIGINQPYNVANEGIFYYGNKDTDITYNGSAWLIDGKEMVFTKGVIYIDGNLYISGDLNFNGMIMATGNIVFLGNSSITYDETLINDMFNSDVNINGFFNLLTYEVPDETIKSQRVVKRNISIDKWSEY